MNSSSSTAPRRWLVLASQVVLLAATFAGARYWSTRLVDRAVALPEKNASIARSGSANPPASIPAQTTAGKLAQAKANLAQILHMPGEINRKRGLLSLAAELDADTLKGVLADLESHPAFGHNKQAIAILAAQWAESDPQAALNSMRSIVSIFGPSSDLVGGIFDAWSAKDPAAALAAISQLPANVRQTVRIEVVENIAIQNPQSALSFLLSLPNERSAGVLYDEMFSEWASHDPSAAATAALNLPSSLRDGKSSTASVATWRTASTWALQDPSGALAWANALPAGQAKTDAINSITETMSQQNAKPAVDYATQVAQLLNGPGNNSQLKEITTNWAQDDPAGLLSWANNNLTGDNYVNAAQNALKSMVQADPAAAAAALTQISDPSVVNPAIAQLATNWAAQDVHAALAWAQSLPADNAAVRNSAISNVLKSWTITDPSGAATYIQQNLTTDPAFGKLATEVVNNWGNFDPQSALTWAQSLPPGSTQTSVVTAAITQLAKVDPQAAWNDALQLSGSSQDKALSQVISSWATQQPDQAAAAVQNLPEGKNLDSATAAVAKNWLIQDPGAASQWISTLPQGSARDSAVNQIISTVGKNDPASAFNWAATISNETTRNTQVVKLAGQWSGINATAAAAAAQNAMDNLTGLTTAQITALQKVAAKAPQP